MKKRFYNLIFLGLIGSLLVTSGFGCKAPSQQVQEAMKPVTLEYWRVYDDQDSFQEIIDAYHSSHPNIKITYRKFRPEEYEQALLDAWAEDRGPDIFSIDVNWLKKYASKIQPLPPQITMAYQEEQGTIQKQTVYVLKTTPTMSLRQLKDNFVDVVYKNVVINGQIYALPLSLETLVMFYNKDILNSSGVSQLPATWNDFQNAVKKTTRFDSQSNILRAGAAIGTGSNVGLAFDILSLLMEQNGAPMANADGYPTFITKTQEGRQPGMDAIQFYLDFASPQKDVYTWNSQMPDSFQAFLSGNVGFTFGYNHSLATIRAQAPRLNFGVAPVPQVSSDNPKNYADYWIETVSKKSAHTNEAWDFVSFAASQEQVKKYLDKTKQPTALRALINGQLEDEDLHSTSLQSLTADNWYVGQDYPAAVAAIKAMIDQLLGISVDDYSKVITIAIQKINQTIQTQNP